MVQTKKQVRLSEDVVAYVKQDLLIPDEVIVTPDELMIMLLMKSADSRKDAQLILDQLGSEFSQRVAGTTKPRLRFEKGHYVENGELLHLDRLLAMADTKDLDHSSNEILQEVKALRQENRRAHHQQTNLLNVFFLSIRTMVADILRKLSPNMTAKKVVDEMKLSDETSLIRNGADTYAFNTTKEQAKKEQHKQQGHFRD